MCIWNKGNRNSDKQLLLSSAMNIRERNEVKEKKNRFTDISKSRKLNLCSMFRWNLFRTRQLFISCINKYEENLYLLASSMNKKKKLKLLANASRGCGHLFSYNLIRLYTIPARAISPIVHHSHLKLNTINARRKRKRIVHARVWKVHRPFFTLPNTI